MQFEKEEPMLKSKENEGLKVFQKHGMVTRTEDSSYASQNQKKVNLTLFEYKIHHGYQQKLHRRH